MKPTRRLIAAALLGTLPLLSPQLTHAAMAAPTQQQVIDRFIAYSNYEPQFQELPQMVEDLLKRDYANELSGSEYQELTDLLKKSFKIEQAKHAMTQQLSLGYDNGRYRVLIQKLENASIRKLRTMEQAVHEPVARHEMKYFIARLPNNPVPPKREALIKDLLEANGAVESEIKTRAALQQVVREVVGSVAAVKSSVSLNDSLEQNRILTETLRPKVQAEALAAALYTYRDATDEEVRQYIDFYNSPAGQWFKVTQQNGWIGALHNIGRDIAWKMQQSDDADLQTALGDDLDL